jgi:ribosomal protein L37AE/L43A
MTDVHQTTENAEALDQHRPDCPQCNLAMWLFAHVTEHLDRKKPTERRTYVCEMCGTTEVVRV